MELTGRLLVPAYTFGNHHDQAGHNQADQSADEKIGASDAFASHGSDLAPSDGQRIGNAKPDDGKQPRCNQPLVERAHNGAVHAKLDEEGTRYRGYHARTADHQRIEHHIGQRVGNRGRRSLPEPSSQPR